MKTKKNLIILTTAAMIAMGSLTYAQDNNAGIEPVKEESVAQDNNTGTEPATEESASQVVTMPVKVNGVVAKKDNDFTLFDGKTTYHLKGEKDLDTFADKTVTVSGYSYTSDNEMVILVSQIGEFN